MLFKVSFTSQTSGSNNKLDIGTFKLGHPCLTNSKTNNRRDENPPVGKDRVLSIFDNRFILFSNLFSTFGNGFTVSENLSVFNPYVNSECRRQKKGKE